VPLLVVVPLPAPVAPPLAAVELLVPVVEPPAPVAEVVAAPPMPLVCEPVDAGRPAPSSEHDAARAHPSTTPKAENQRFIVCFSP
jgi:hypothetical protein